MQRGIKQASDAYARVAASVGSLERIVELHDRGVFRDAAHTLGVEEVPVRLCEACAAVGWSGIVGQITDSEQQSEGGQKRVWVFPTQWQLFDHVISCNTTAVFCAGCR